MGRESDLSEGMVSLIQAMEEGGMFTGVVQASILSHIELL